MTTRGQRQAKEPAAGIEIGDIERPIDRRVLEDKTHQRAGGTGIGLKKRRRRNQKAKSGNIVAHVTAALDAQRFAANHVGTGTIMDVDEKAGRALARVEKLAHRRAQGLVVLGDDQHGNRFPIIVRRAHQQMAQHAAHGAAGSRNPCALEMFVQSKREAIRAIRMHRTLGDRNHTIGLRGVVANRELTGRLAKDKRRLLSKPQGQPLSSTGMPRGGRTSACGFSNRIAKQIGERLMLAGELVRIGRFCQSHPPHRPK